MNATLTSKPISISTRITPPNAEAIRREIDDHGICHLIFDMPGSTANIFTRETMDCLRRHIDWLANQPEIQGVLLRSAKPSIFIAGADLHTMLESTEEQIGDLILTGQRVFDAMAELPMPKAAAIHGACLGGGFELALACDYRIASNDPATKIGLPETQLGLVPAWGGCTRLPRLIGVREACQVILKGTPFSAFNAKRHGLVDEIVPAHCLVKHAIEWLLHPTPPARLSRADRFASPIIRTVMRGRLQRSAHGNYPALPAALELVSRSPWRTHDDSLDAERKAFETLFKEPGCRNLIRLFFAKERARKLKVTGMPRTIDQVAVIGAGVMGCGISYWLSTRGHHVLLTDVNAAALAAADARLSKACLEAEQRHILTRVESKAVKDRITLATNEVPLSHADLVIEAAIEDPAIKRKLFGDVILRTRAETLVASNTSAIPLGGLMEGNRLIGLHFFNPVHAMPLVEIVRPSNVADDDVATAVKFIQGIGKIPLVVKDSPGFLVNRVLMPYLLEAARMVHEGATIASVDQGMLSFGMPMGPLRLLDEVGLDVALHVVKTLAAAFPETVSIPDWLEARVKSGLFGVKSGSGYYIHAKGKDAEPSDHGKIRPRELAEAQRRLPLLLTNEAARCLDEGVAASAADIDLGMVLGTGYAPFRGGPLRFADAVGLRNVVAELNAFQEIHGALYKPAAGMITRAAANLKYHSEE